LIDIIRLILNQKGIDVNQQNQNEQTPFYIACQNGHDEVVRELLRNEKVEANRPDKYSWPRSDGMIPISIAFFGGYIEVIKLMVHYKKVDINYSSPTPLCINLVILIIRK
jgi:ankyrin repeat protein